MLATQMTLRNEAPSSAMPKPETTIVCVCFNSLAVLQPLLQSLPEGVPCLLVDNGSDDAAEVRELAGACGARFIENSKNLGFGCACNLGAAAATTDLVLFLNPDAVLCPGAIDELQKAAKRYPEAVAFNPTVLDVLNQPANKRSSVLIPRRAHFGREIPDRDHEVPVLSGAALLVRRTAFDAVGGFDENIFLYHEDDDLSLRLRAECGPLMHIHQARVRHVGGSSSPRNPDIAALKARHMGQSRVYTAQKHGVPFGYLRALLSAILHLLSPQLLFSKRKRAKQWAFLLGVIQARDAFHLMPDTR